MGAIAFLIVAVVVIWFTMNRSLKTTDQKFEPGKDGLLKDGET